MEYELYKSRSYRSVIVTGIGYYLSHFRHFIKSTWKWALLFAVFFAAWAMLMAVQLPAVTAILMHEEIVERVGIQTETAQSYLMVACGIVLTALLALVVWCLIAVKVRRCMNDLQSDSTSSLPRSWRQIVGYLIKPRHWGLLVSTLLVSGMMLIILISVCCLPGIILGIVHFLAQEGVLNGDPLGMPDYMAILSAITFFITGFLLVYLCMPILMMIYYVYGSEVAFEREKLK